MTPLLPADFIGNQIALFYFGMQMEIERSFLSIIAAGFLFSVHCFSSSVPSRIMRKNVCRLRLNEVSRQ